MSSLPAPLEFDFRATTDAARSRAVAVTDRTPQRASERLLQTARAQRGRACESIAARKRVAYRDCREVFSVKREDWELGVPV